MVQYVLCLFRSEAEINIPSDLVHAGERLRNLWTVDRAATD